MRQFPTAEQRDQRSLISTDALMHGPCRRAMGQRMETHLSIRSYNGGTSDQNLHTLP
jgi:hypothetical protein